MNYLSFKEVNAQGYNYPSILEYECLMDILLNEQSTKLEKLDNYKRLNYSNKCLEQYYQTQLEQLDNFIEEIDKIIKHIYEL